MPHNLHGHHQYYNIHDLYQYYNLYDHHHHHHDRYHVRVPRIRPAPCEVQNPVHIGRPHAETIIDNVSFYIMMIALG